MRTPSGFGSSVMVSIWSPLVVIAPDDVPPRPTSQKSSDASVW